MMHTGLRIQQDGQMTWPRRPKELDKAKRKVQGLLSVRDSGLQLFVVVHRNRRTDHANWKEAEAARRELSASAELKECRQWKVHTQATPAQLANAVQRTIHRKPCEARNVACVGAPQNGA
jgi:hypothetical protein